METQGNLVSEEMWAIIVSLHNDLTTESTADWTDRDKLILILDEYKAFLEDCVSMSVESNSADMAAIKAIRPDDYETMSAGEKAAWTKSAMARIGSTQ